MSNVLVKLAVLSILQNTKENTCSFSLLLIQLKQVPLEVFF